MAEIIKFAAPEIGIKKAREIKPTNKLIRQTWKLQLEQVKTSNQDDPTTVDDLEGSFNAAIKLMDDSEDFLVAALKLNGKQRDLLEDLTQEELGNLVGRLMYALMNIDGKNHQSDEAIEPDPKSVKENA